MSDGSGEDEHNVSVIVTPDEMLYEGLLLAGFSREKQESQPKSNAKDFENRYGSSALVLALCFEDLQSTECDEARVSPEDVDLRYYLMAHHFMKAYQKEHERKCTYQERVATQRDWVWFYVEKICALQAVKIVWPQDHIDGDDIWIMTVDGTMSSANEKAGEDVVKDPDMFDFKHHSAGFNTEVGISIKESRCIGVKGPGNAGVNNDRGLYRKKDGLRDKLKKIKKKGIADGGYTGDNDTLSTPNAHDSPSCRKFKSRALKRHEKFNHMLKSYDCLAIKHRHGLDKYTIMFDAVVVMCQYQLENDRPLWNIYVGNI